MKMNDHNIVQLNITLEGEASNSVIDKSESVVSIQTGHKNKNPAKRVNESTGVKFPFRWAYAKIKKLSDTECEELNRVMHYHRKPYQKPCSLCGVEGAIAFKKTSNGNVSLICEQCAKKYVINANRFLANEFRV